MRADLTLLDRAAAASPGRPEPITSELLAVVGSRHLSGVRLVFAGIGLPTLACGLAQHTVAPLMEQVYESGCPAPTRRGLADEVTVTAAPSDEELRLLREVVDPDRVYLR